MAPPLAAPTAAAVADPAEPVPVAVWLCAQQSGQYQRAGRYLPASTTHPGKMLPELARRIIGEYSAPGGLVVDPLCGIGTTLVEGALLGRRVLGVELEPRWAKLARANLDHALPPEPAAQAQVRVGDARQLTEVLADVAGQVDLVATSPPYACDIGMIDKPAWQAGRPLCRPDTLNYASTPANLGHARGHRYLQEMALVYGGCRQLLRPGGLLVTVTKNLRRKGRLLDLAAATVTLCEHAGFAYLQHVLALHAAVRDGGLSARPSFWQLTQTRKAHARGEPAHLVVHEDVLVFTTPPTPADQPPGGRQAADPAGADHRRGGAGRDPADPAGVVVGGRGAELLPAAAAAPGRRAAAAGRGGVGRHRLGTPRGG